MVESTLSMSSSPLLDSTLRLEVTLSTFLVETAETSRINGNVNPVLKLTSVQSLV